MKLRTGDSVVVITGKDRGKTGTILRVLHEQERIVVGGVAMRTKHMKKTAQQPGQIIRFEGSIHVSNVMILDPKTKKRARIGYKIDEKGKKIRISKKSGEEVVHVKGVKTKKEKKIEKVKEGTPLRQGSGGQAKETTTKTTPKKGPFWKRMGFGAGAMQDADSEDRSAHKAAGAPPSETVHVRGGSRGS